MYMELDARGKPVGMCENDSNAIAVLNQHWKDTLKYEDIQTAIM